MLQLLTLNKKIKIIDGYVLVGKFKLSTNFNVRFSNFNYRRIFPSVTQISFIDRKICW